MEGMRGFAVFLVFLVHYSGHGRPWLDAQSVLHTIAVALETMGHGGVDLFFVLSGYLIYGSLISRPQPFKRFMARRVERIYPAFLVVFAIYLLLSFVFPSESKIPPSAFAGATYLVANLLLLPGIFPIKPLITVAWSLSFELLFYLAIPLLIASFRLRRRSRAWRVSFFTGVALAFTSYCAVFGGHVYLIMFVSGILVYEALDSARVPIPGSALGLLALVVGLSGLLFTMGGFGVRAMRASVLFASFFVLCASCIGEPTGWLPRALSWTPLRWLGNMSYSYYLLHGLALRAIFPLASAVLPVAEHGAFLFWALMPILFALTLIPTAALFLLVERPISLAGAGKGVKSFTPRG